MSDPLRMITPRELIIRQHINEMREAINEVVAASAGNSFRVRPALVGDGVTDNRTAILAAIAEAEAADTAYDYSDLGSKLVEFGPGVFAFSGVIAFPTHVAPIGQGRANTVFKALDATAQIQLGDNLTGTPAGGEWQASGFGGFTVDGAGVANVPLAFGLGNGAAGHDIHVRNAAQDGVLFSSVQNLRLDGFEVADCGRDGVVYDMGAGGIDIYSPHIGRCDRYLVAYRQSAARPVGGSAYASPQDNAFYDGLIEYPTATTEALVFHDAGDFNSFHGTQIVGWGASAPVSLVKMRANDGSYPSTNLMLDSCRVSGGEAQATALDLAAGCRVALVGETEISYVSRIVYAEDNARVDLIGRIQSTSGSVTSRFVSNGGTQGWNDVVRLRTGNITHERRYDATTDVVEQMVVEGEAGMRMTRMADGELRWADGSTYTALANLTHFANNFGGATTYHYLRTDQGLHIASGAWNGSHLILQSGGGYHHLWVDGTSGDLYYKPWAAPTSAVDGTKLNV